MARPLQQSFDVSEASGHARRGWTLAVAFHVADPQRLGALIHLTQAYVDSTMRRMPVN